MSDDERKFIIWSQATSNIEEAYDSLVDLGMPAEDARGIAPTNIGTRVHYSTDLRSLLDHAGNRLCTQAQFEWRMLWAQILPAIRRFGERQFYWRTNAEGGREMASSEWQFNALSDIFRPACYLTGKCEFAAMDLDRACSIRDRVDANAAVGRKSDVWHLDRVGPPGTEIIPSIHPAEWAADPAAARVKG